ncbi:MAG TPA: hypothetical protein VNL14_23275 [Candidatus Acidoferrales bacterium]|nr:hypothetical protein [Candidatus Acidoferrales bacterium]
MDSKTVAQKLDRAVVVRAGLEIRKGLVVKTVPHFGSPTCYRQELEGYLRLAELLSGLIAEITATIKERVLQNAQAKLLMTVPGISYYSAPPS